MKIQINGESRDFPGILSLSALVETLGMKADRVAVELNRNIVPRGEWFETQISEGDCLEIVQFVGGGLGGNMKVDRRTVDLSSYPDLVVVYLGMRVNTITGIKTLLGFGPKISNAVGQKPDGLLLHEQMVYSLFPPHVGMREYWRDFESLERWTRSDPHKVWWKNFLRDSGGTGFWHESYFARGGMEAIYVDMNIPIGFSAFAPVHPARGPMFSARTRLNGDEKGTAPPITEAELYDSKS